MSSSSSSTLVVRFIRFDSSRSLHEYMYRRAHHWNRVLRSIVLQLRNGNDTRSQFPIVFGELIGYGRSKLAYSAEYMGETVAAVTMKIWETAYCITMSSQCPNCVRVLSYSPIPNPEATNTPKVGYEGFALMELLQDPWVVRQKYDSDLGYIDNPILQIIFSFFTVRYVLEAGDQEWHSGRNWGIRTAQEDEEYSYSALANHMGFRSIRIKVKKGDYVPVLYDYWIANGYAFGASGSGSAYSPAIGDYDHKDAIAKEEEEEDDGWRNTVYGKEYSNEDAHHCSLDYAWEYYFSYTSKLKDPRKDSQMFRYLSQHNYHNELRNVLELFAHKEEFPWLIVETYAQ
jgi:hypothetical protein